MKDNEGYDGTRIRYHEMWAYLEMEYERQMWENWKRQYPDGFPWDSVLKPNLNGVVTGKVMMVSTVDLCDSGQSFKDLWNDSAPEKESGLYRVFSPEFDDNIDNFGFKKEDDENL